MDQPSNELFKVWHYLYQKEYKMDSTEAVTRFRNFKESVKRVISHNADTTKSWKIGLNQFSDLTVSEFQSKHLSPIVETNYSGVIPSNGYYETKLYYSSADGPASWDPIDYTVKCGKVWDQLSCGCCYAFSMVNAIECNFNIATNVLPALSRQQIVDCNPLTGGCNGGNPPAVSYYAKSQGLMNDADYIFKGVKNDVCSYDSTKASVYVDGAETTGNNFPTAPNPFYSSSTIYNILTRGSLSVCIDANPIMDYSSGIIELTGCSGINHAVMIVGYGAENGKKYWIVKNSWNTWWGEKGYMRVLVKDDAQGNCFLYNNVFRPFKN
jgi:C1A family cysteine protease